MQRPVNHKNTRPINQNKKRRKSPPKNRKPYDKLVLMALILGLLLILYRRTYAYLNQVTIQTNEAVLRKEPDQDGPALKSLAYGQRITILVTEYHWIKVETDTGLRGWIGDWTLKNNYSNKITNLDQATIVVDAGHGGSDSGALSISGKQEKKYTLKYAKTLAQALRKQGAKVYLTRSNDTFVGLSARPTLAEQVHADAFVSIHFDSNEIANSASGFTTYYYHKEKSLALAKSVNQSFGAVGLENRGVAFGDFLVIRDTTVPSILLEMGYINTRNDFEHISSSQYRIDTMNDVVSGLKKYFKQQK